MSKWTLEEVQQTLKTNADDTYGAAVSTAALYKKLYGEYPKIGLSGAQAEFIDILVSKLPDAREIGALKRIIIDEYSEDLAKERFGVELEGYEY